MVSQGSTDSSHTKSLKERLHTKVGETRNQDMRTSTGRPGQTTKQNYEDQGSTCHPAQYKEGRQAEPASGERFFYTSPKAGAKVAFLCLDQSVT